MIMYILAGIAVVLVVLLIVISTRPSEFCVTRSAPVDGPTAEVFANVNELRRWQAWSPWAGSTPA